MNTPAAIGRLQARGASLIYQTIGYQTIGATGPSTMPFIFQHGMGGDANQPLGYIGEASPTPVISLNARGHSPSTDINAAAASFDVFADDVIALADHLGLFRFIIGGISLGAGTALNLAVRYPDRVTALVLCRPAWLDRPQAEFNRNAYTEIADLLDRYPAEDAAKRYPQTRTYQTVRKGSPAAAASLLGQLTRPRAAQNSVILRTFPGSARRSRPTPGGPSTSPRLSSGTTTTLSTRTRSPERTPTRSPAPPCAPSPAKTPMLQASPPTSEPHSATSSTDCEHNVTVSTDQPSARPRPQPGHIYVVVDLGGTQTRTAIFDPTGQMLTRRAVATPRTGGPDEVIAAVLEQIREATAQHRATVVAVGVSALGPVDPNTGIIHSAPTLPGFDNVPLGPRLHDALQLPVHVHNDANAATIAEWQLGAGRGTRHFCYVTVSTGMGCGIISNGQLVTGRAYAGELGRTRIPSTDGSTAQLEQISSGTAIAARTRALIAAGTPTSLATIDPTRITAGVVAAAAAAGDHLARSIFTAAATTLGIQLANLTRLVDPETIALGGGVTLAGDIFWDPLRATIEESLAQDSIPLPSLVEAELHSDAGLHGAAIALLNHYERAPA